MPFMLKFLILSYLTLPTLHTINPVFANGDAAVTTAFSLGSNEAFSESQKLRAEGLQAIRDEDLKTALQKMKEAHLLRPTYPILLQYLIFLAKKTGDVETALAAAKRYAAIDQSPGQATLKQLEATLPEEQWLPLKAKFLQITRPAGRLETVLRLPTKLKLVEDVAVDKHGAMYFSTVISGNIYKQVRGKVTMLLYGKSTNIGSFFGMAYHAEKHTLFATFGKVAETLRHPDIFNETGVIEIDLETKRVLRKWTLKPRVKKHQIADIVITKSGVIYASDSMNQAVYKLTDDKLELAFDLPHSISPQGLAETTEGHLILADFGRSLWLLNPKDGSAMPLQAPSNIALNGIDGLASHKGKLIAIQNGGNPHKILEITISKDGLTIENVKTLVSAHKDFDEPTLGTSTEDGFLFVGSSQWAAHSAKKPTKPTKILRLK